MNLGTMIPQISQRCSGKVKTNVRLFVPYLALIAKIEFDTVIRGIKERWPTNRDDIDVDVSEW